MKKHDLDDLSRWSEQVLARRLVDATLRVSVSTSSANPRGETARHAEEALVMALEVLRRSRQTRLF